MPWARGRPPASGLAPLPSGAPLPRRITGAIRAITGIRRIITRPHRRRRITRRIRAAAGTRTTGPTWLAERLMGRTSDRPPYRRLEILRRLPQGAPHMRRRAAVEAQALFRLAEVAADDVGEFLQLDMHVGVERIDVVHGDHPRRAVPFMRPRPLVLFLDIGLGLVVLAEIRLVIVGVRISGFLVGVKAQRLVR